MSEDRRPSNCRNRLRDEHKPYPKSGCAHCQTGGMTGCPFENGLVRPDPEPEWLVGLEPLGTLSVQAGDQVVLMCPVMLTMEQRERIEAYFTDRLQTPVVVLDNGMKIGVVRKGPES